MADRSDGLGPAPTGPAGRAGPAARAPALRAPPLVRGRSSAPLRPLCAALSLLALLSACAASPEPAPTATEPEAAAELLRAHATGPERAGAVLAVARVQAAALACRGAGMVAEAPRLLRRVPRFDAGGRPVEGIWITPVRLDGCAATPRLNVLTRLVRGGEESHVGLAPGATRAEPVLQPDALRATLARLPQAVPGCRTLQLTDTQPAPGGDAAVWRETWIFRGCGRRVAVPVTFRPADATTGAAAVSDEAVRVGRIGE